MSFITTQSFTFNGISSHDYNLIVGWLNSSDPDVSTNGLNREVKKTANTNKIKNNVYGAEYTDVITFNFSIFKENGEEITRAESIKINQWLTSSPTPKLLQFNDSDTYPLHYYAICTHIKDIIAAGRLVGKELTFETNSPYAFSRKEEKVLSSKEDSSFEDNTFYLNNPTDSIYYPTITINITPYKYSDLRISIENVTDRKSVTLTPPKVSRTLNEVLTIILNSEKLTILDGNNNLIPASQLGWNETYASPVSSTGETINTIYWPRLLKGTNEIKVSGTYDTFKIEYEYPRKAGCL